MNISQYKPINDVILTIHSKFKLVMDKLDRIMNDLKSEGYSGFIIHTEAVRIDDGTFVDQNINEYLNQELDTYKNTITSSSLYKLNCIVEWTLSFGDGRTNVIPIEISILFNEVERTGLGLFASFNEPPNQKVKMWEDITYEQFEKPVLIPFTYLDE